MNMLSYNFYMRRNDALALRIISSLVTALLAFAVWRVEGPVWLNFLLGVACGLSIGIMVIVWQKELHWVDGKIYPSPTELGLRDSAPPDSYFIGEKSTGSK